MRRARRLFNNGVASSRDDFPNFRIFETFASGATLLQQDFPLLRAHFKPFVHYAPVTTVHQLTVTAKFLLKHDAIAGEIAREAREFYGRYFGGAPFWRRLTDLLYPSKEIGLS